MGTRSRRDGSADVGAQAEIDAGRGRSGRGRAHVRRARRVGALRREVGTLRMERDTLKTFGHGAGRPTCWTRNSARGYADVRPGVVAVCLMVTSGARKKTWSGGGLRT